MMAQVNLRPVTEADLTQIVIWRNDPEVMQFMGREAGETTLEGLQEWLARVSAPDSLDHEWMIEVKGRAIGGCGLQIEGNEQIAYLGIYIGEKMAWGKGYGTAVIREALRFGFAERNLHRIHLGVFPENPRAIRCYEKCGFRHEGFQRQAHFKGGGWRDLIRMAILREEWEALNAPEHDGLIPIRPEQVKEVLAVWQAAELWPHTGEDEQLIAGALVRNQEFAFGWRVGGKLVATAIGAFDGFRGWIYRVAVIPEYRRQGFAAALVQAVEEKLWQAGARQINLMVYIPNSGARALYEKLGYEYCEVNVLRKRFQK